MTTNLAVQAHSFDNAQGIPIHSPAATTIPVHLFRIMKILFDHPLLFALAQGEQQVQMEQTRAALPAMGIEVELVRQWHARQGGNQIRCFGAARYV